MLKKEKNIRFKYVDNECYCAIGYLGKLYGVDDSKMHSLGTLPINMSRSNTVFSDLMKDFNVEELHRLQSSNDYYPEVLIKKIDSLIETTMEGEEINE